MKRLLLLLVFVFISVLVVFLSNKESEKKIEEIRFIDGNLKEALQKAGIKDKLVFVDCYTSWCAPCKWMDKHTFKNEEVYSYYNSSFINYKVDMEKGEGPEIAKRYKIRSFPTYLFLNSDGEIVHKAISKMGVKEFLEEGKKAFNPKKSIGVLSKKYVEGNISTIELIDYAVSLRNLRDPKTNDVFGDLMISENKDWLKSVQGFKLIENFVYKDTSELFIALNNNKNYFNSLVGKDAVNKVFKKVLMGRMNKSSRNQKSDLFFEQLDSLKKLTANVRDISKMDCKFYLNGNNVEGFVERSNYYVENFLLEDPETISDLARSALFKVKDGRVNFLNQASVLVEKAYLMNPNNYGIVGTYAEIQSKIGNKEEAIKAAEKAVKMADTISSKVKRRAERNLKEIRELFLSSNK